MATVPIGDGTLRSPGGAGDDALRVRGVPGAFGSHALTVLVVDLDDGNRTGQFRDGDSAIVEVAASTGPVGGIASSFSGIAGQQLRDRQLLTHP